MEGSGGQLFPAEGGRPLVTAETQEMQQQQLQQQQQQQQQQLREMLKAVTSTAHLEIHADYGWVLLVLLLAVALLLFFAFNVTRARLRFGIRAPDVYAVKGVTGRGGYSSESDETLLRLSGQECDLFNCYQRAYQHAVELYVVFVPCLLCGGCGFPRTSAVGGLVFLLGCLVYGLGYYTGDPKNRRWGSFQIVGLLTCVLTTFFQAIRLLWAG